MPGIIVDVPPALDFTQWIFTAALIFHIRLGIELYQFGKGFKYLKLRNGKLNWLAILLQGHLVAAIIEASLMTIMLGGFVKQQYCQPFIRGVYSVYVFDVICISTVLYFRAFKVNNRNKYLLPAAFFFPALEIASRITEGVYIDGTIDASYVPPGMLSPFYGFCGALFGWPTTFITVASILNDCVQMLMFGFPIYMAIRKSHGFGATGTYTKILMNSAIYLAIAAIFYIASAALGSNHNTWGAVTWREVAQLAHTLGACELQFNDHRKTTGSSGADSAPQPTSHTMGGKGSMAGRSGAMLVDAIPRLPVDSTSTSKLHSDQHF
ncbi:uncharacterized protein SPPG_01589 [Spizellomyces punctatus DAOM BR117]|uniref:Uncharacterized protein n=1 Tax=Spizellomyces punctatus (strain DAOM BR117) TaxID=645134 RepID=A0A0L0HTG0_SPIPD|nr:uncharacterized protein SPPG_01589 [Spizellomyces punctatus DAOM BR117]KND04154.1 hypothetical protein SPPG_01589 [Spizellomyces punctatus DAOM BR117]|eukprot:XP_016612193.1 hypothetical protein SPPG_01589 [Spizellomyces punctatus DAOM BR117]